MAEPIAAEDPVAVRTVVNVRQQCLTQLSDTAVELLKYRLYTDTEGIWVRCYRCDAWRYLANRKDPSVYLNLTWDCSDVDKLCGFNLEDEPGQEFIEVSYCAGSLVWAKRPDSRAEEAWPWWPALVEDCPDDVSQYFLLDESGTKPIAYHVTYLDAYRTCCWVSSNLIKPFEPPTEDSNKPSTSRAGQEQRSLKEAIDRATIAATQNVVDRLENFSYIAHRARLDDLIEPGRGPFDNILNGADEE